jgi:transcriptional regulator with XRE-family HTH domain
MDITEVYEVRRNNLGRLIAARSDGNQKAFAVKIGRAPAQVSQWLKGRRNISDETRDHIETACNAAGWLDAIHGQSHVTLGPVTGSATGTVTPAPTLDQALEVLGIALAHDMPDDVREDLADALAKLARRHGQDRDQKAVAQLLRLEAGTAKRTGT